MHKATPNLLVKLSKDAKRLIFTDVDEKFVVEIKRNNETLFNGDGEEGKKKPELTNNMILSMDDHIVKYIYEDPDPESNGFYLVSSLKYDDHITISHTQNRIGKIGSIKLPRDVEPLIFQQFDMIIKWQDEGSAEAKVRRQLYHLILIGMKDDEFTLDFAKWLMIVDKQQTMNITTLAEKILNHSLIVEMREKRRLTYSVVNAFSINWPYVAYSGLDNELVILNAFQQDQVHRVELCDAEEEIDILATFITDTRDLFVLVHRIKRHLYDLYMLDLDACNEREQDDEGDGGSVGNTQRQHSRPDDGLDSRSGLNDTRTKKKMTILKQKNPYDVSKPIFSYAHKDVNRLPFRQIHVRGSSQKDKINFNENLILFVLHGSTLWSWTRGGPSEPQKLHVVQEKISSKYLQPKNDSCFFFRQDMVTKHTNTEEQTVVFEKIIQCEISTSNFQIKTIFIESALTDTLLSFNYDKNREKVIMFLSTMSNTNKSKLTYKLKVYDCKTDRIQFETLITQPTLIGRLQSSLYTFSDGHIYYSNNVIKLRYDLIEAVNSYNYNEYDIFDYYEGIFDLENKKENKNLKVLANTPLESIHAHKLAYIISDRRFSQPNSILILPYLHENRIYLNRIKLNTSYFISSIETPMQDVEHYNKQVDQNQEYEHESNSSLDKSQAISGPETDTQKKNEVETKLKHEIKKQVKLANAVINNDYNEVIETFTSILVVNQTEYKYYIYQQNGILVNRVNYK